MIAMSVSVEGREELKQLLDRIAGRGLGRGWIGRALETCANRVQAIAAREKIISGSRFRGPAGPRGGKGKLQDAGVHPTMLTSRHGGSGLVGSIRVNKRGLPRYAEVGSDKVYAPIHELGGSIRVTKKMRGYLHYKGIHLRKSTTRITMPPRPFLQPALEQASHEFSRIFVNELSKELRK